MGPMPDGRCLIVPDIHEEYGHLRALLQRYEAEADRVIWLGDFLDSFSGYTRQTVDTVEWLRDHVENPKYTFLWGNHDLHYAWPLGDLICSGYDPRKQLLVND